MKIIVIVKKNEKIGEIYFLKKHFGHPLWVTIIFILKKCCMVIIKKERKGGKEKKTKQKLLRSSREYAQSGTRIRTRAVEKKRETRNEH
jgi:hypothetical protein